MKQNILEIPILNLTLSFIPLVILLVIMIKNHLDWKSFLYATLRMITQLITIGYFLTIIFNQENFLWTLLIVLIMMLISSWISLYSIKKYRLQFFKYSLLSLLLGALPILLLVTIIVIPSNSPWYAPSFFIPLAGMIFSHSLNTISLSAERYIKEIGLGANKKSAKNHAFKAALIPHINSFFAVGLVALPGMMTGQILSGIDPLIAVRYQIVVMTMVMGSGGISAAIFLYFLNKDSNNLRLF